MRRDESALPIEADQGYSQEPNWEYYPLSPQWEPSGLPKTAPANRMNKLLDKVKGGPEKSDVRQTYAATPTTGFAFSLHCRP